MNNNTLILIDGNSLVNRAFYAIPPLTSRDGTPTNAIYGFVNMLVKLIDTVKPKYIAAVFDMRAPTFRHKMCKEYKATRKGMPDDLACQMPLLKELLGLMHVQVLEKEGFEADDIIGTIATKEIVPTIIVTGDRDSFQLVSETTSVHFTKRGISEVEVFTPEHFLEVYGFEPERLVDLKALMGDASDNIAGVKGVGEKTALDLIQKYGSLEGVYTHLVELKSETLRTKLMEGTESADMSYRLATICRTVPIEYSLANFTYEFPFSIAVRNKFEAYAFRGLLAKTSLFCTDNMPAQVESTQAPKLNRQIIHVQDLQDIKVSSPLAVSYNGAELSFSFDKKTEYFIRFDGNLLEPGDIEEEVFRAFGALSDRNIKKTVFDYKSFRHAVASFGVTLDGVEFDVQLAQYVADCTRVNDSIGAMLDNIGLSEYSGFPSLALAKLRQVLTPLVEPLREVYYDLELPVEEVLFRMEQKGVLIDMEELDRAGARLLTEINARTAEIHGFAGHVFNLNSPKQIGHVLYEEMGLEAGKKTKKKALSTSADALEELRGTPIVDALLRYRFVMKLYGTYVEGMRKLIGADHVIHTVYKQTVTSTGRLSSIEPNLQNIPVREEEGRQLRRMFVARPGYQFVSADYSQIELRLMAHFSQEPALIEAYNQGQDIHSMTASQVFGVPLAEVTSSQRRDAKAVNFGIIYGISDFGLAKNLGISVGQARKYILGYFMHYPRIKDYMDGLVAEAHREGKLSTPTGRIRRFDNINSSNFALRSFSERAAMNMPLQATAADLIKIAMLRVDGALQKDKLDAYLLLQIHDELIIEVREELVGRVEELVKKEMESAMALRVPLVASVSNGKTWFDL